MTPKVGVDERRRRLGRRHLLAAGLGAAGPEETAEAMVALHATDPASVHLAVAARFPTPDEAALERALYDHRTLIRMLGMRRTMFVVRAELASVIHAACTVDIAAKQRTLLEKHLAEYGVSDNPGPWLKDVEESTLRALTVRGSANASDLVEDEPRLREQIGGSGSGKAYDVKQYITSRVLFLLAADGKIVRGRPRGSWISSQYAWSTMDSWVPGGLADLSPEAGRVELARRWLAAYGPAPVADLRWWTGWTAGQAKKALTTIGPTEVDLDGVAGIALPDDIEPTPADGEPWVALLPALDPTPMGWAQRDWFLGPHGPHVFDRTGNIGPTVWADGRIVGGWAQRATGGVVYRLLEDVGSVHRKAIEAEAARLTSWLGPIRVTPRFRTPLERELVA